MWGFSRGSAQELATNTHHFITEPLSLSEFLKTSRAQDRIVLLFVGHATEVEDEPYLVPLEGELTVKKTLIPLSWLYEKLAKCKARSAT